MNFKVLFLPFCLFFVVFSSSIAQNTKKDLLFQVYQNLINSYADARPAPELIFIPKTEKQNHITQYIGGIKPIIKFDEILYDKCNKLGKDSTSAIAILLSHELAHYYENHTWCSDYAFALQGESIGDKLKLISKEDKIRSEAQADQMSIFYALMTGYDVKNIFPRLIDTIYQTYCLPEAIAGYPSKSERKTITKETEAKVIQLYHIFEAAKHMMSLEKYDIAISCFENIAKSFPSREILHNLGSAYLLQALLEMPTYKMPFILPIETDKKTRLFNQSRSINEEKDWKKKLKSAQRYFEYAIKKDPNYALAYQNLACVYLLEDNPDAAIGKINELKNQGVVLQDNALIVKAFAHYFAEQKEKANSILSKVTLDSDNKAIWNWVSILSEPYNVEKHGMDFADFLIVSQIQNSHYNNTQNEVLSVTSFDDTIQITDQPFLELSLKETPTQTVYQLAATVQNYTWIVTIK